MIERGQLIEKKAVDFLKSQGLDIYTRNFRCKLGELDVVALDNNDFVFVEVRYRKSNAFGGAAASVTRSKQQKMIRTAQVFLNTKTAFKQKACRFDVIAVSGPLEALQFEWLKNVIYM